MADDKAKIDWAMLEAAATPPAPVDGLPPELVAVGASPQTSPAAKSSAASAGKSAPAASGKIAFHCPNGHRIVAAATMAGQRGKCSKCGAAVRIPGTVGAPSPSAPSGGAASIDSPAKLYPIEGSVPEDHGAAPEARDEEMQEAAGGDGRAHPGHGLDVESESREDMFSGLVTTGESHTSETDFLTLSRQLPHPTAPRTPAEEQPEPPAPWGTGPAEASSPPNPTAALMARLFEQMEHGGVVEVTLAGGTVFYPEFYEARWSAGSHALFASRAADGTVTLTAVAWDSIQKIIVRKVDGLPDGMFE